MYVVLRVYKIYFVGDWSNGMIGVSKTFGGSSILSSPVLGKSEDTKSSLFLFARHGRALTGESPEHA